MIPIDPHAGYDEWVHAYLADVDTIPALLVTLVTLATPSISASRTDTIRVSGTKREDYVPVNDTGAHWELDALWSALCDYVTAVSGHDVAWTPWPLITRSDRPTTVDAARSAGYAISGWLAEHVEQIVEWVDLGPAEQHLQGMLHVGRFQHLAKWRPRRETPDRCTTCGELTVRVMWELDPTPYPVPRGAPAPRVDARRVRVCTNCGEQFGAVPAPRRWVGSSDCLHGRHDLCESLHCDCDCGHREAA